MQTQFGLANVWSQGDIVTRSTAVLLLLMSLASWMVIITKALDLRKLSAQARATESFWHSADFADGLDRFGTDPANPFRVLAIEGREATAHVLHKDGNAKPQLHDALDLSEWVTRSLRNSIDDITASMQSGLAVLASVGSTAPFVGLFGTVWGIYHALLAIGLNGQASIRPGRRARRRGPDHDRARPGGGDSGGAGLQRPGARQQIRHRQAEPLCP